MCECKDTVFLEGNDATFYKENYLQVISIDAKNWKTLYKCKICNMYWEETFIEDRFVGIPELKQVNCSKRVE